MKKGLEVTKHRDPQTVVLNISLITQLIIQAGFLLGPELSASETEQ